MLDGLCRYAALVWLTWECLKLSRQCFPWVFLGVAPSAYGFSFLKHDTRRQFGSVHSVVFTDSDFSKFLQYGVFEQVGYPFGHILFGQSDSLDRKSVV